MAKRGKRKAGGKLGDFAEDLGSLLGTTERKATEWLGQRELVAARLAAIRDKASSLLTQLAGNVPFPRKGKTGSVRKVATKNRGRRFTAAQREQQAERMRAYWAKRKAKATKKRTGKTKGGL
jgi:hypothetical protein